MILIIIILLSFFTIILLGNYIAVWQERKLLDKKDEEPTKKLENFNKDKLIYLKNLYNSRYLYVAELIYVEEDKQMQYYYEGVAETYMLLVEEIKDLLGESQS